MMSRFVAMSRRAFTVAFCLLFGFYLAGGASRADTPVRVLLVDGASNHDWQMTTRLLRAIIEPTGLFEVTVSTAPPKDDVAGWQVWRPDFKAYDVVLQTYNDYGGGADWPEEVKRDFEAYVSEGGGVLYLHSANNAFVHWPEYNEMIGVGWRKKDFGPAVYIGENGQQVMIPANTGRNSGHGPRSDALVTRIGDHPVHRDLPRQWMTADVEHYHHIRGPAKNLTVLSYALEPVTQMNWPLEWQVNYGKGRGYVFNYGHVWEGDVQPVTLRSADVQVILIRALQWLAGRDVTYPVPTDFPTKDAISVRGDLPVE